MSAPRKEHLIDVAEQLFYHFGFHATGVDRIQAESGVAKTTLYKHFASKDELIQAVLERARKREQTTIDQLINSHELGGYTLIYKLLDRLATRCADDNYNGCLFANAASEFMNSNGKIRQIFDGHLDWLLQRFTHILSKSRADTSSAMALLVIYQGFLIVGRSIPGSQLMSGLEASLSLLFSPESPPPGSDSGQ